MELIPRMRTIVAEPGAPEVPMFTPAALPCNCCVAEEPEDANSSSVSITRYGTCDVLFLLGTVADNDYLV